MSWGSWVATGRRGKLNFHFLIFLLGRFGPCLFLKLRDSVEDMLLTHYSVNVVFLRGACACLFCFSKFEIMTSTQKTMKVKYELGVCKMEDVCAFILCLCVVTLCAPCASSA